MHRIAEDMVQFIRINRYVIAGVFPPVRIARNAPIPSNTSVITGAKTPANSHATHSCTCPLSGVITTCLSGATSGGLLCGDGFPGAPGRIGPGRLAPPPSEPPSKLRPVTAPLPPLCPLCPPSRLAVTVIVCRVLSPPSLATGTFAAAIGLVVKP